jgi:asparagine synthase (glutamine-hydrolysing)
MCGIFGEFGHRLIQKSEFLSLNDLNYFRGPDSSGYWTDNNVCQLGFRRLAIIDLSPAGNQPMISPNGRFVMVFNGEIYNYKDLQSELGLKKENLKSHSDSEVVINAFQVWGVYKTAERLNGIFAIALFDRDTKSLYLIRDFAGVKPLYYGVIKDKLVFGSQYDQVFKHPDIKNNLQVNTTSLNDYVRLGYIPARDQYFQNTYQVLPGTILKINSEFKKEETKFFEFKVNTLANLSETSDRTLDRFNDVFDYTISNQLMADVSVGTFLSGGVDSPLVTARAKQFQKSLQTFTIGVHDQALDESIIAQSYAEYLGAENHMEYYDKQTLLGDLNSHFKAFSEPFGDYSSLPSYQVCKMARQNFTVALSGDGGDELFWGYPRFLNTADYSAWFKYPLLLRRIARQTFRKFGNNTSGGVSFPSIGEWVFEQQSHNKSATIEKILPDTRASEFVSQLYEFRGSDKTELLKWLRWNEFYGHLQRVLLKVDRTSMANSLEVRVPFLDKNVIAFASDLNPEIGSNHRQLKYILKKALSQNLPPALINQTKKGFSVPIEQYLRNDLKLEVLELLVGSELKPANIFDSQKVKKYVLDFMEGKNNSAWGIWQLFALQKWYQVHVEN